jgi:integrase
LALDNRADTRYGPFMAGPAIESAAPPAVDTAAIAHAEPLEIIDLWNEFPEFGTRIREALRSYAPNTQLGLRADWRRWRVWCASQEPARSVFPAAVDDVIAFALACSPAMEIDERGVARLEAGRSPAHVRTPSTLRRYLHTIGAMHRLARIPDPTKDPDVATALRRVTRSRGAKRQKTGINRPHLEQLLGCLGDSLWDLRARALLLTAYCTLARSAELVALNVDDLKVSNAGDGYAVLHKTKTDQQAHGSHRYLAVPAVEALRAWLDAVQITDGPVFRRLHKHGGVTPTAIRPHEVSRLVRQIIRKLPMEQRPVGSFAGHSTRIGGAQDLVAAGQDLLAVMQAGGWRDPKMPARYTEHLAAMRGGMARLWGRGSAPTDAGPERLTNLSGPAREVRDP